MTIQVQVVQTKIERTESEINRLAQAILIMHSGFGSYPEAAVARQSAFEEANLELLDLRDKLRRYKREQAKLRERIQRAKANSPTQAVTAHNNG